MRSVSSATLTPRRIAQITSSRSFWRAFHVGARVTAQMNASMPRPTAAIPAIREAPILRARGAVAIRGPKGHRLRRRYPTYAGARIPFIPHR
jgi:hypothetical protein